jgi:hypothetical protein
MNGALEAFKECGWAAYLCLFIGALGVTTGFVGALMLLTRSRRGASVLGGVALALGLAAVGAGILGRQRGLAATDAALSGDDVDPSMKERIRAQGELEANQCVKVGGAAGGLPIVLGVLAVSAGLVTRKAAS